MLHRAFWGARDIDRNFQFVGWGWSSPSLMDGYGPGDFNPSAVILSELIGDLYPKAGWRREGLYQPSMNSAQATRLRLGFELSSVHQTGMVPRLPWPLVNRPGCVMPGMMSLRSRLKGAAGPVANHRQTTRIGHSWRSFGNLPTRTRFRRGFAGSRKFSIKGRQKTCFRLWDVIVAFF